MNVLAAYGPEQWAVAAATLLGAVGAFITAIYAARQGRANNVQTEQVGEQVGDVHDAVKELANGAGVELHGPPAKPNTTEGQI